MLFQNEAGRLRADIRCESADETKQTKKFNKIPYLKLHCEFFLSPAVFLYYRTVYEREKRKKVAEKSSDYADYKLLKSALSNQCSQVTINSSDSRQYEKKPTKLQVLIAGLGLVAEFWVCGSAWRPCGSTLLPTWLDSTNLSPMCHRIHARTRLNTINLASHHYRTFHARNSPLLFLSLKFSALEKCSSTTLATSPE